MVQNDGLLGCLGECLVGVLELVHSVARLERQALGGQRVQALDEARLEATSLGLGVDVERLANAGGKRGDTHPRRDVAAKHAGEHLGVGGLEIVGNLVLGLVVGAVYLDIHATNELHAGLTGILGLEVGHRVGVRDGAVGTVKPRELLCIEVPDMEVGIDNLEIRHGAYSLSKPILEPTKPNQAQ